MQADSSENIQIIDKLIKAVVEVRDVFSTRPALLQQLPPSHAQFQRWIQQLEEQRFHSSQRFTLMVLGEYNAGKSTFLNALLELPPELRLPTGDDPVTGKPLRLLYTDGTPSALLLMRDGTRQALDWKQAVNRADQRLSQAERSQRHTHLDQVKEVQLFLNHPLLTNADILDMPGTGTAEFKDHTQLSRDYLDNVEMIIWVIGETEPSKVGGEDFKKALHTGAPIAVVFNAWGSLKNKNMEIDQDALEQGIFDKFPELEAQEQPFRIYARKCLETQDRAWEALKLPSVFSPKTSFSEHLKQLQGQPGYKEKIGEFGLQEFTEYLWHKYLESFDNHRIKVRQQAFAAVRRLSMRIVVELEEVLGPWNAELGKLDDEHQQLTNNINRLKGLRNTISIKIKALAEPHTQNIVDQLTQKINAFIEDKVTPRNFDIWKNIFDPVELKKSMAQELETKYLMLNQPNNIFDVEANAFVEEAKTILNAEWQKLLADIELEMRNFQGTGQQQFNFHSILERVTKEALSEVQQTILVIVTSLAGIVFLIFGSLIALIIMAIAAPFGFKGGPSPEEKAKQRIRDEISMQYHTIKKSLTDIILDQNGMYGKQEAAFHAILDRDRTQSTGKINAIQLSISKLQKLQQTLDLTGV